MDLGPIATWLADHGLPLLIGAVLLFIAYRVATPAIHRLVVGLLRVQQATLPEGTAPAQELAKRAETLEQLLGKVVRAILLVALLALVLSVFDLWSLLAGLGLVAAALTLAGQDIVLDYLMGILILTEGPYYTGDWISIRVTGGIVEGQVEEVGLRRTVLRDKAGAVHSISNGLIRSLSNLTRVYSVVVVEFQVLKTENLDGSIALAERTCGEIRDDPAWAGALLDAPAEVWVTALTLDGATIRLQCQASPDARWTVASELRRRLAIALAEEGIGTGRWDTPMPAAMPPAEGPPAEA